MFTMALKFTFISVGVSRIKVTGSLTSITVMSFDGSNAAGAKTLSGSSPARSIFMAFARSGAPQSLNFQLEVAIDQKIAGVLRVSC